MKQPADRYFVWYEVEPLRNRRQPRRYHWMIRLEQNPDELVSWGNAPTKELAEIAAEDEVNALSSGLSHGGQVPRTSYLGIHHC